MITELPLALSFWNALADPWREPIMQRAFAEIALVSAVGGALGVWIILYELSYAAESLAHSLFPGLVVAVLIGVPLVLGGALGLGISALAIVLAARVPRLPTDVAIGVVVTSLLGVGALIALSADSPPRLGDLLFGDVLAVNDSDLALAAGLGMVALLVLNRTHGRLLAFGFDRTAARRLGLSRNWTEGLLLALLGVTLLVAVQGLGNMLVIAVLIGPAATARLLTDRADRMLVLAAGIGVVAGAAGLYLSYHSGFAAGGSVASVIVLAYALVRLSRVSRIHQPTSI